MAATVPAPPNAPDVHRFRSRLGEHVLLVPFSAIYDVTDPTDDPDPLIRAALLDGPVTEPPLDHIAEPAPQSISLNVSNRCNLSCVYCYASGGNFQGAQDRSMTSEVARTAIDRLLTDASRDAPVTIGFLGGEPFANTVFAGSASSSATFSRPWHIVHELSAVRLSKYDRPRCSR